MPKSYNETRVTVKTVDSKGEEQLQVVSEEKAKELTDKGEGELVKVQTFVRHEAESQEDFSVLVANPTEVINLWNRAYAIKEAAIMRDFMLGDEDAVEGSFDLTDKAAEESTRRKMTPVDKAKKILSMLSPEQFAELLKDFEAAKA